MARKDKFKDLKEAEKQRQEAKQNALNLLARKKQRNPDLVSKTIGPSRKNKEKQEGKEKQKPKPLPPIIRRVQSSLIDLFRDEDEFPSTPSSTLVELADLYLYAAEYRSRHIALVWPATLKTLTLVQFTKC